MKKTPVRMSNSVACIHMTFTLVPHKVYFTCMKRTPVCIFSSVECVHMTFTLVPHMTFTFNYDLCAHPRSIRASGTDPWPNRASATDSRRVVLFKIVSSCSTTVVYLGSSTVHVRLDSSTQITLITMCSKHLDMK